MSKVIKVSSSTSTPQLTGSIVASLDEGSNVEIRAIGASAVNQMYKALASARGIVATKGKELLVRPGYDTVTENGNERTVMVAYVVIQ